MLSLPCRRFCNLILEWLIQHCDPEVWEKEYREVFFGDPEKLQREREARARVAPSQKGQEGSLNIERKEAKPVVDMSQFFGRAGGAGKPDQNKEVVRERAKLTIAPDGDGNLTVSGDDTEG